MAACYILVIQFCNPCQLVTVHSLQNQILNLCKWILSICHLLKDNIGYTVVSACVIELPSIFHLSVQFDLLSVIQALPVIYALLNTTITVITFFYFTAATL